MLLRKKAQQVFEVLGGKNEDYYELVGHYCFSNVNDLVEMLINDPKVLEKHNSYIWAQLFIKDPRMPFIRGL